MNVVAPNKICPYCLRSITVESKDHIFPRFLGGHQTILVCQNCNSEFGGWFEGKSFQQLHQLQVLLSSWGIDFKEKPIWKNAISKSGKVWNLQKTPFGIRHYLAKPHITYSDDGSINEGDFRNEKEAKDFFNGMVNKGKAMDGKVIFERATQFDLEGITSTVKTDGFLRLTVLKMAANLATLLPEFDVSESQCARQFLNVAVKPLKVENVFTAYDDYPDLDNFRLPLSHLIYVERKEYISAVVQFFGFLQFYCHLGDANPQASESAIIATLDPVTGLEKFITTSVLNVPSPDIEIPGDEILGLERGIQIKMRSEAEKRGAIDIPQFHIKSIHIGE